MENIGLGIQLMVVGMSTVFLILMILISGGKLLINFVNKVAPEEVVTPKKAAAAAPATIDAGTMAVLQEVVKQITGGKGHVASAKKI
jgi:oxaloacetate decarboxylase gamma subunit